MCKSNRIIWDCGHESELHQEYCAPKCEELKETTKRLEDPCIQCGTPRPSRDLEISRWGELIETHFRAGHSTGIERCLGNTNSSQPEVDRVNRENRTRQTQIPASMLNTWSLPPRSRQISGYVTARTDTPLPNDAFSEDVPRRHTNFNSRVAEQQHPISQPSSRQNLGNGTARPGTPLPEEDELSMEVLRRYTNFDSEVPEQQHQPQRNLNDSDELFRLDTRRPGASPVSWSPRELSPSRSTARELRPSAQSAREVRVTEFREPGSGSSFRTRLRLSRRSPAQPQDAETAEGGQFRSWREWRLRREQIRKETESKETDKNGYVTLSPLGTKLTLDDLLLTIHSRHRKPQ